MTGETNLSKLIANMQPVAEQKDYVFLCVSEHDYQSAHKLRPVVTVQEAEGWTIIVPKDIAEQSGHQYQAVYQRITLNVHSSLEAVGLTAAFASQLASHGLSANVVAGYYHDHIFIEKDKVVDALQSLQALTEQYS